MSSMVKLWLIALSLGVSTGIALGQATAASLHVHPAAMADDPTSFADRAFERGLHWAHGHGIVDARDCPEPDQYFLSGCVSGSDAHG